MAYVGNDAPGSNAPGPGVIVYLTPQGTANAKGDNSHGWGTPFGSFWCCYGSTVESYAKLADSIYFYRSSSCAAQAVLSHFHRCTSNHCIGQNGGRIPVGNVLLHAYR